MTSYGWKLQVKCNDYSKNFDKDGSYFKISLFRLSACENTPQTVNTQSEFLRQIKHLISYTRKNDKALAQKSVYISTYRYLYIYTFTVANCHLEWQNCLNCFLWFYGKKKTSKEKNWKNSSTGKMAWMETKGETSAPKENVWTEFVRRWYWSNKDVPKCCFHYTIEISIHLTLFNYECVRKLYLHINQVWNLKTLFCQRKISGLLLYKKNGLRLMMNRYFFF